MDFIQRVIDLARANVEQGGRPFACVIVKGGRILAEGVNRVAQTHDPTAHAEMCAIREAAAKLQSEYFTGCEFFLLTHPCPMCLGAMYQCSPDRVVFATTWEECSRYYTDDRKYFTLSTLYEEIAKPWDQRRLPMSHESHAGAIEVYRRWKELNGSN
jgi:tRNA(Arg) A34 adenosine deaminase TadA